MASARIMQCSSDMAEREMGGGGRSLISSAGAFGAACDRARGTAATGPEPAEPAIVESASGAGRVSGPQNLLDGWQTLAARIDLMPVAVRDIALRGLRKVVDYQDIAYGRDYLDRLDK